MTLELPVALRLIAPAMLSWSVRQTGERPNRRQRAATRSGALRESNEAELWTWRSTRIKAA